MYIYPAPISALEPQEMPRKSSIDAVSPSANAECSAAQRVKLLARVAAFYHRGLMDGVEGLRYLTKIRGIREVSLFKTFQVGLANGGLLEILPQDEATLAELRALGVLPDSGREFFQGCVVFPLWSAEGALVSLRGRRMSDEEELSLSGEPGLSNAAACKRSASILLADSILDALSAIERGLSDAMPCLGVEGLSTEQLRLFEQCGVKRVAMAFRGEPGHRRAGVV